MSWSSWARRAPESVAWPRLAVSGSRGVRIRRTVSGVVERGIRRRDRRWSDGRDSDASSKWSRRRTRAPGVVNPCRRADGCDVGRHRSSGARGRRNMRQRAPVGGSRQARPPRWRRRGGDGLSLGHERSWSRIVGRWRGVRSACGVACCLVDIVVVEVVGVSCFNHRLRTQPTPD